MPRSVHVGLKGYAFLRHLAQSGQGHDLKPAAICQDRAIPIHKSVQTAKRINTLCRGTQHKVIGIAKKDIRPRRTHTFGHHRLYGCSGAHGHKGGRSDLTVWGGDQTGARLSRGGIEVKGKSCAHRCVVTQDVTKAKVNCVPTHPNYQASLELFQPSGTLEFCIKIPSLPPKHKCFPQLSPCHFQENKACITVRHPLFAPKLLFQLKRFLIIPFYRVLITAGLCQTAKVAKRLGF